MLFMLHIWNIHSSFSCNNIDWLSIIDVILAYLDGLIIHPVSQYQYLFNIVLVYTVKLTINLV